MTRDNIRNKTSLFLDFIMNVHRPPDDGEFLKEDKKEITWRDLADLTLSSRKGEEPKFDEINEKQKIGWNSERLKRAFKLLIYFAEIFPKKYN
jgi:hypothetical protein